MVERKAIFQDNRGLEEVGVTTWHLSEPGQGFGMPTVIQDAGSVLGQQETGQEVQVWAVALTAQRFGLRGLGGPLLATHFIALEGPGPVGPNAETDSCREEKRASPYNCLPSGTEQPPQGLTTYDQKAAIPEVVTGCHPCFLGKCPCLLANDKGWCREKYLFGGSAYRPPVPPMSSWMSPLPSGPGLPGWPGLHVRSQNFSPAPLSVPDLSAAPKRCLLQSALQHMIREIHARVALHSIHDQKPKTGKHSWSAVCPDVSRSHSPTPLKNSFVGLEK